LIGVTGAGVTLIAGEKAVVAWNGVDFVKVGGYDGNFTAYSVIANGGYSTLGGFNAGTTGASPSGVGISFSTNISNGSAEGDIWNGADPSVYTNTGILFTQRLTSSTRRDLMFLHNSGNVGIGTNSPNNKLMVSSTLTGTTPRSNTVLRVQSEATGRDVNIQLSDNVTNSAEIGMVGGPMYFATGGTEKMRIDSSGNVGIGTSSPTVKLEIQQNQAGYSYFDYYNTTNAGGVVWRQIVRNIANTGNTSVDLAKLIGGGFSINNNDANAANFTAFGIGGTERMRIDSSGSVGIGTTSPSTYGKLVSVTGDNATTFAAVGATNMLRIQGYNSTYVGSVIEAVNLAQSANTPMFVNASQTLFGISGTERMRIDSSGNVGIGTSTPTFRLVSANNSFDGVGLGSSSTYSFITLGGYYSSSAGAAQVGFERSTGAFVFGNGTRDTPTERMRIGASGQIGIGGANYGTSGQVLTSQGNSSPPIWSAAGVGSGQSWTAFTVGVNRLSGTTYYNSTSQPIAVCLSGSSYGMNVTVGGVALGGPGFQSNYYPYSTTFIVPVGVSYVVNINIGGMAWAELR
jgi:hypothetical protein